MASVTKPPKAFQGAKINEESSELNKRDPNKQPPFSYFESSVVNGGAFRNNNTALWILVLGFDASSINQVSGGEIQVVQLPITGAAPVINASKLTGVATQANFIFSRKFFIPPNYGLFTTSLTPIGFQALEGTFEDLQKFVK